MKEERPWGWYDVIDDGDRYKVKSIEVKPGEKLSLQKHHHRSKNCVGYIVREGSRWRIKRQKSI